VGGYELGLDYAIISGPRDGNGSNHNCDISHATVQAYSENGNQLGAHFEKKKC